MPLYLYLSLSLLSFLSFSFLIHVYVSLLGQFANMLLFGVILLYIFVGHDARRGRGGGPGSISLIDRMLHSFDLTYPTNTPIPPPIHTNFNNNKK